MKRKFSKILGVGLALALVLSLSLVGAVPAAANPSVPQGICLEEGTYTPPGSDGVASWAKAEGGVTPPAGTYMAKLVYGAINPSTAAAKVRYSGTLTALSTLAGADESGMTFNYYYVDTGKNPYAALYLDTDDDGVADLALLSKQLVPAVEDTWNVAHSSIDLEHDGGWHIYGYDADTGDIDGSARTIKGKSYGSNDWNTLAGWAALDTDPATTTFGDDADVLYVGYMLGGNGGTNHIAYVDDITIGGVTYELEPIFLDKLAYGVGDTVEVTVPNFAANTDPNRINPVTAETALTGASSWNVKGTSTSDAAGITVTLGETGANTGVFTGSFATTGTIPVGEDEVYVQEGDTITVTYTTTTPFWGEGNASTTTITAKVDETPPTFTADTETPSAGDVIQDAMPKIYVEYTDATAGIDATSVEMLLDGVAVAATATTAAVTYTPTQDLANGSHGVTVNVSDKAGNAATKSWSFSIASWLPGSPVSNTGQDSLDALATVGVAVSDATGATSIRVGRYATNPQPGATLTFTPIENGFFDVQVIGGTATLIVIKFADDNITAESKAYVWDDLDGLWLECSDQYYSVANEYLRVKVRTTTIPSIAELEGTPFAISGVPEEFDPWIYDVNDDDAIQKTEALAAIADYFDLEITKTEALEVIALYFG